MPTVQYPNQGPRYNDNSRSEVLHVRQARIDLVKWVNDEGRESLCLTLSAGLSEQNGKKGPAVFILADEEQLKTDLKIANSLVCAGVRKAIAADEAVASDDIPDELLAMAAANAPQAEPGGEEAVGDLKGILGDVG